MIKWYTHPSSQMSVEFDLYNTHIQFMWSAKLFADSNTLVPLYHIHSETEFFFVKQGECVIQIEGKKYPLRENSFAAVPGGKEHYIFRQSSSARIFPVSVKYARIRRNTAETRIDLFGLLNKLMSPVGECYVFNDCSETFEKIDEMAGVLCKIHQPFYREYFEYSAVQFFICLLHCIDTNSMLPSLFQTHRDGRNDKPGEAAGDTALNEKDKRQYIRIIENYLHDLSHKKILLAELAGALNLGVRQTQRLINELYKMDFTELFCRTRIAIAKSVILDTSLPVESVAEQVGYSYKGFLHAFKRITGKTPAQFRKNK